VSEKGCCEDATTVQDILIDGHGIWGHTSLGASSTMGIELWTWSSGDGHASSNLGDDACEVRVGTENGRSVCGDVDVQWLRDHVAVASQHPHLFDARVADNIRYGTSSPSTKFGLPDYETATSTCDDKPLFDLGRGF
jgi:hypothetical protein